MVSRVSSIMSEGCWTLVVYMVTGTLVAAAGRVQPDAFVGNVEMRVSGFWGLPPPVDSPFMGDLTTPKSLLQPTPPPAFYSSQTTSSQVEYDRRPKRTDDMTGQEDSGGYPVTTTEKTKVWSSLFGKLFGKGGHSQKTGFLLEKYCKETENPSDCNESTAETNNMLLRITGGQPASPKRHPYMALVGYGPASNKEWLCGGSLITERFVLTAAHCLSAGKNGPALWVRLGDLDLSTNLDDFASQEVRVTRRIPHPEYRASQVYFDIGLLVLEPPGARLGRGPFVRPVCLLLDREDIEVQLEGANSRQATVSGWGRTGFVSDTSDRLMEADVRIFNSSYCQSQINPSAGSKMSKGFDPKTMICAGSTQGGKDACQGDSGGPLIIRNGRDCSSIQVGIISVGKECGLADSPGIYTRVSTFLPWIQETVSNFN